MIPIVRAFADPRYRRVVAVVGSQMGKTDACLNVLGTRLEDDPAPALYVGPTRNFVEGQLEPRLMAMLHSASELWARTGRGHRNKKTAKSVSGVDVRLAWAGSATELAAAAVALALVDERDRMGDLPGEGDPVELIEARGSTFADFTMGVFSTPTLGDVEVEIDEATGLHFWRPAAREDVESPTWRLWQEGTRFHWVWQCRGCGGWFVPRRTLLQWPKRTTPVQVARLARLVCPRCGHEHTEADKPTMNAGGRFVAPGQAIDADGNVTGDPPENDTASFWVSGLASPWRSFGDRARAFLAAAWSGDHGRLQATVNTGYGELFRLMPPGMRQVQEVQALKLPYRQGEVPDAALVLTAGVDVQADRLPYAVRAWGPRMESWLIEAGDLFGNTEEPQVWTDLGRLLDRDFSGHRIKVMNVDTGFRAHAVYEFARRFNSVRPTKGQAKLSRPIAASQIDVTVKGTALTRGLTLWHVDSDHFKSWVHGRLSWPPDQPGGWHLPADVSDSFCEQIVAETRILRRDGSPHWAQVRRENHALDCEALNVAAAYMLNLHTMVDTGAPRSPKVIRSKYVDGNGL